MSIEIQQLKYCVLLAQERHFARAAERANVTQPTLSQQIQKLERELGVTLFERSRQVRLTEAGKKFLPCASNILERLRSGIEELSVDSLSGTLAVAAIPTVLPYLMPDIIAAFRKKAPKIKLDLFEEKTSTLLEKLKNGLLDLGLLALPVREKGIAAMEVGRETLQAAVSIGHPLARKTRIRPADLFSEKIMILQEGHCFGDQTLQLCGLKREDSRILFQGTSLVSILRLLAKEQSVTVVPESAIERHPGVKFIPFADPEPVRRLAVVWRLTSPLSRAEKLFADTIQECLQKELIRKKKTDKT